MLHAFAYLFSDAVRVSDYTALKYRIIIKQLKRMWKWPRPNLRYKTVISQFWGFRRGAAKDSVVLGYNSASLNNRIPTFRGLQYLQLQGSKFKKKNILSMKFEDTTSLRNVGIRLPSDAASYTPDERNLPHRHCMDRLSKTTINLS